MKKYIYIYHLHNLNVFYYSFELTVVSHGGLREILESFIAGYINQSINNLYLYMISI